MLGGGRQFLPSETIYGIKPQTVIFQKIPPLGVEKLLLVPWASRIPDVGGRTDTVTGLLKLRPGNGFSRHSSASFKLGVSLPFLAHTLKHTEKKDRHCNFQNWISTPGILRWQDVRMQAHPLRGSTISALLAESC